jgi:excisionase family DNA binding protein
MAGLWRPLAAAKYLDLSLPRVYELVRLGLLPAVKFGRTVRFDPAALAAFVAQGGTKGGALSTAVVISALPSDDIDVKSSGTCASLTRE